LLQYYNIKAQLLSYHKFNEAQREQAVLTRLKQGEIVALISDAGTPGISDPGTQLAKMCAKENIDVIPIPGACAVVAALSASGLETDEFTFVGFLPKHSGTRKERLIVSSNETRTQIFYVPPHKLSQFLEETTPYFGESRQCVIAREITKLHEEFWRGSIAEAKQEFLIRQPKGEITLLIEGKEETKAENPTESQLEEELRGLISDGHSLSTAVKTVAERTSMRKKEVYSLALKKFGKQIRVEEEDEADE
jgi:16S rRNA (cytidine1402-2'-O)-methyltransferase